MNPYTPITIQFPDQPEMADVETTWAAFVADNDDDTITDVRKQIEANNYAVIGGGASPLVWVFA